MKLEFKGNAGRVVEEYMRTQHLTRDQMANYLAGFLESEMESQLSKIRVMAE